MKNISFEKIVFTLLMTLAMFGICEKRKNQSDVNREGFVQICHVAPRIETFTTKSDFFAENKVWICLGEHAYAYHKNPKCKGLRKCGSKIIVVDEQVAQKEYNRTKCKLCY